jgi:hypothetical protein
MTTTPSSGNPPEVYFHFGLDSGTLNTGGHFLLNVGTARSGGVNIPNNYLANTVFTIAGLAGDTPCVTPSQGVILTMYYIEE